MCDTGKSFHWSRHVFRYAFGIHQTNPLWDQFSENDRKKDETVTEEEIKAIISEGTESGTIEEEEKEIIERIFHLGDRNITSLMTHRSDILWFDLNDTEEKIREKIIAEPHSIYPVCDAEIDNIKGFVSIKDLYIADDITLFKDLMQPALFVPENNTAYQVMEKFKESKNHSCFIVDEYGSLLGMITLNDILEAIVGEIAEASDVEGYEIVKRDDGSFLVDAQIPFYDFLSYFNKTDWLDEDEHDFDTLAGCILYELERIPQTGDKLNWKDFSFEVIDMDGHRIDKVLVICGDHDEDNGSAKITAQKAIKPTSKAIEAMRYGFIPLVSHLAARAKAIRDPKDINAVNKLVCETLK